MISNQHIYASVLFLTSFLAVSSSSFAQTSNSQENPTIGVPSASKGKAFNPDVSANFLGLLERGTGLSNDRTETPRNGFRLQEAELQFTADVDPYLKAVALFSISQAPRSTDFGIDPEEVFMDTISLPGVTLRAGKFKLALGKHNQLHTHAFPFIDQPLINSALLGDEGLNEVGVSAAVMLPLSWYSEVIVQAYSPSNDTLYRGSLGSGEFGELARLKNLWDLTDDLTAELGLSGTGAKNALNLTTTVFGGDLTFKWRPSVGGKYHALVWQTEYLTGNLRGFTNDAGDPAEKLGGGATWLQYQFAERWWIQGRYERLGMPRFEGFPIQDKQSALLGFFPSEFSGFRLQYDRMKGENKDKADHTVALQYNISIGAHPAHAY